MKTQKTTFVILGILTIEPMSGYDMKKLIEMSISHFWSESNGQLYPTLNQLVKEKLITIEQKERKGKRESHLYSITEAGRAALRQWLEEGTERKNLHRDEELLKLFFGKNASHRATLFLLKKRKTRVQETLSQFVTIQKELESHSSSPHCLYWNLSLKNGIAHAKAELKWCSESIKTIKGTI